jgi:hypothetical protein
MERARERGLAAALAVSLALVTACDRTPRPLPRSEWGAAWARTRDTLLDPAAFAGDGEEARRQCDLALGRLHEAQHLLRPAPDEVLDTAVGAWLTFAERMMFECPARADRYPSFASGFVHLQRLAAEVDVALTMPEEGPDGPPV